MIHSLRTRHRVLTTALAVLLPVGIVAGLTARVGLPAVSGLPVDSAASVPADEGRAFAFAVAPLEGRLLPDGRLVLQPREDLRRPDLRVFWVAAGAEGPDDGLLLGRLAGVRETVLSLPPGLRDRDGEILIYSLAHEEVVDRARLPRGDG
jgi:hypothetical protein